MEFHIFVRKYWNFRQNFCSDCPALRDKIVKLWKLSVSIGISVTFSISSKLRETITSGMGCEILFCKPKKIKDLVNLGVKKALPIYYSSYLLLYEKQYIEGKRKVRIRRRGGKIKATGGKFKNLSEGYLSLEWEEENPYSTCIFLTLSFLPSSLSFNLLSSSFTL